MTTAEAADKAKALRDRKELEEARKLAVRLLELIAKLEGRTVDPRTRQEKLAAAEPTGEDYARMAQLRRRKGLGGKATNR